MGVSALFFVFRWGLASQGSIPGGLGVNGGKGRTFSLVLPPGYLLFGLSRFSSIGIIALTFASAVSPVVQSFDVRGE